MPELLDSCDKYFGSRDFYEVLKINRNANSKEIQKAYHRLSLLVHPDRVEEEHKAEATEKFKVLGKIHSILSDKSKRDIYDESGTFDEDYDALFNWLDYWRSLFKEITIEDIKKYEQEYIGSSIEINDVKRAYLARKGDMDYILESVPFANCDGEARFVEMVKDMIERGEVPEYKSFTEEPQKKKEKRRKKWEKEKAEAAEINFEELQKELQKNRAKREMNFVDFVSNLEAKYGEKDKKKRRSIKEKEEAKPIAKRARSKK